MISLAAYSSVYFTCPLSTHTSEDSFFQSQLSCGIKKKHKIELPHFFVTSVFSIISINTDMESWRLIASHTQQEPSDKETRTHWSPHHELTITRPT